MRGFGKYVFLFLGILISLEIPDALHAQGATASQYLAAANKLYAAHSYAQAGKYYYAAIKLNPAYASAYQSLGNCYYFLNQKPYALTCFQRALNLQPNNPQLAQFVQSLKAKLSATPAVTATTGAVAPAGAAPAVAPSTGTSAPAVISPVAGANTVGTAAGMGLAADPLAQGKVLFQQKQYAAAIPYFQQASSQSPNNYLPYYYEAYSYYMIRNNKLSALYFGVANLKQPNASLLTYSERIKKTLNPIDQKWVEDQLSKFSQAGVAVASGPGKPAKNEIVLGIHVGASMDYIQSDPTKIKTALAAAGSVSMSGLTPNFISMPGLEFFAQVSPQFEVDLAGYYLPLGTMSYTTYDYGQLSWDGFNPNVVKYDYDISAFTGSLGMKFLFGDAKTKGYFGAGFDFSPTNVTFTKEIYDHTGTYAHQQDPSSSAGGGGDYSTLGLGGHAVLGVDFYLGPDIGFGPYIGYKYLDVTNLKNSNGTLMLNNSTGEVSNSTLAATQLWKSSSKLDLDFSGVLGGLNLTFLF